MKRFIVYIFFWLYISISNLAHAQIEEPIIIPQTPTVGSMMSYVDRPVSYFSGTTSVDVPLCEVKAYDVVLPISLKYNSTGCQPAQEASWVGLGWSLSLNACISRRVKCFDDFNEDRDSGMRGGYYFTGPPSPQQGIDTTYFNYQNQTSYYSILDRNIDVAHPYLAKDSEADIFSFSFWGGSGKFILKYGGYTDEVSFFDMSEGWSAHIEKDTQAGGYVFILTSKDGTKYEFRKREESRNYSKNEGPSLPSQNDKDKDENTFPGRAVKYISSWFLTKIITTANRQIVFDYQEEKYEAPVQVGCTKYDDYRVEGVGCCPDNYTYYTHYYLSKTASTTYRLNRIYWANGEIRFFTSGRQDMKTTDSPVQKLDSIVIYDSRHWKVRSFEFSYSYFNPNANGPYDYLEKRLRLDSVKETEFPENKYCFTYNDGTMPEKNTKKVDYWGYYNGKEYGSEIYCAALNTRTNKICPGAIKNSSLEHSLVGVLSSVTHPTGGTETFEYELNRFNGVGSWTRTERHFRSGSLQTYNPDGIHNIPIPETDSIYIVSNGYSILNINGYLTQIGGNESHAYYDKLLDIRHGNSTYTVMGYDDKNPILYLEPGTYVLTAYRPPIGYLATWDYELDEYSNSQDTIVYGAGLRIKSITGGGKTRNFSYSEGVLLIEPCVSYHSRERCNDGGTTFWYLIQLSEPSLPCSSLANGNIVGYGTVTETDGLTTTRYEYYAEREDTSRHPFIPQNFNFQNGQLQSITSYDADNNILNEKTFEYTGVYASTLEGFYYKPYSLFLDKHADTIRFYLKNSEIETYYSGNISHSITKSYSYNSRNFLSKEIIYDEEETHTTDIKYTTDFSDALSVDMWALNMILPKEVITKSGYNVSSWKRINYANFNGIYLPSNILERDIQNYNPTGAYYSGFEETVSFDSYYSYGRIKQKTQKGIPISYIWSYHGEYPVAEVVNCTFEDLSNILGTTFIDRLFNKMEPTSSDVETLKELRNFLPDASVTVFTYKPLVGVSTITGPNGITTYYSYDRQGNLSEIYNDLDNSHMTRQKFSYKLSGSSTF